MDEKPVGADLSVPPQEQQRPKYTPPPPPADENLHPHGFMPRAQLLSRSRQPRVLISPQAYKHMQLYIELARKEVGWLGTVTRLENGDFFIEETFLLEQEVTPTETELSVEGQGKLVDELLSNGEAGIEQVNRLRFWGHSHVRMGTTPSGTDERTMERWQAEGLPWAVRGIFNKLGRAEFTVYLYDAGYRICDAPWAVLDPASKRELLADVRERRTYGPYSSWQQEPYRGHSAHQSLFSAPAQSEPFRAPDELQPSDELRKQITEEFAAKVSERLLRSWWGNRDRDDNWSTTYNGPSYHDGAPPYEGREPYRPQPWQQERQWQRPPYKPVEEKKSGWSFWKWLFGQRQNDDTTGGGGRGALPPRDGHDRSDTQ